MVLLIKWVGTLYAGGRGYALTPGTSPGGRRSPSTGSGRTGWCYALTPGPSPGGRGGPSTGLRTDGVTLTPDSSPGGRGGPSTGSGRTGWSLSPPAPLPEGEGVFRQAQDDPSTGSGRSFDRLRTNGGGCALTTNGVVRGALRNDAGVGDVRMGFFRNWSKLALPCNTPVMRNRLKLRSMYIGKHFRRSLPAARRRLADGHRIGGATPNYPSTPHAIAGTALTPVPLAIEAGTGHGTARSLSFFAMTEGIPFSNGAQRAVQDSKERLSTDNLKGDFVK